MRCISWCDCVGDDGGEAQRGFSLANLVFFLFSYQYFFHLLYALYFLHDLVWMV